MDNIGNYLGVWEFSKDISFSDLKLLISELKKDKNYVTMTLTNSEENKWLHFEYQCGRNNKTTFNKYINGTKKLIETTIKKKPIGWNITNSYIIADLKSN